jgi:hypothetical protein
MSEFDAQKLLSEGRRWVLHPGDEDEHGVRGEVVFEDCPWRFQVGEVSNDPSAVPPVYLGPNEEVAREAAIAWTNRVLRISPDDWHRIVASSIAADCKARRVMAKRDPQTSEVTLLDGNGEVLIVLEEKDAIRLYQQIAQAFDFQFTPTCPHCTCPLDEDGNCPNECELEGD